MQNGGIASETKMAHEDTHEQHEGDTQRYAINLLLTQKYASGDDK